MRSGLGNEALEGTLSNRSVSRDKREQRRHVGADHPRALGDPRHGHVIRADLRSPGPRLGNRIGRHDRLGCPRPVVLAQVGNASRQTRNDALDGQRFHDHTRRERQNLTRIASDQPGRLLAARPGAGNSGFSGTGIGVAGVDEQRPGSLAGSEVLFRHLHRRGTERVLREHPGDTSTFCERHEEQILAPGLPDAGFGDTQLDALYRKQIPRARRTQVDSHSVGRRVPC